MDKDRRLSVIREDFRGLALTQARPKHLMI
jgi:hypothetical protein